MRAPNRFNVSILFASAVPHSRYPWPARRRGKLQAAGKTERMQAQPLSRSALSLARRNPFLSDGARARAAVGMRRSSRGRRACAGARRPSVARSALALPQCTRERAEEREMVNIRQRSALAETVLLNRRHAQRVASVFNVQRVGQYSRHTTREILFFHSVEEIH